MLHQFIGANCTKRHAYVNFKSLELHCSVIIAGETSSSPTSGSRVELRNELAGTVLAEMLIIGKQNFEPLSLSQLLNL